MRLHTLRELFQAGDIERRDMMIEGKLRIECCVSMPGIDWQAHAKHLARTLTQVLSIHCQRSKPGIGLGKQGAVGLRFQKTVDAEGSSSGAKRADLLSLRPRQIANQMEGQTAGHCRRVADGIDETVEPMPVAECVARKMFCTAPSPFAISSNFFEVHPVDDKPTAL